MIRGNRVGSVDLVPQIASPDPYSRLVSDPTLPGDLRSCPCPSP